MLKNQIALVTGVSSGIGRETALLLAERGARVLGTVRQEHPVRTVRKLKHAPLKGAIAGDKSINSRSDAATCEFAMHTTNMLRVSGTNRVRRVPDAILRALKTPLSNRSGSAHMPGRSTG